MHFGIALVYIVLIVVIFLWWYIRSKYTYWQRRGIPYLEPIVIPYGNLKNVAKTIHLKDFMRSIYEKFKGTAPFIGVYFFAEPVAIVLDLDLAKNVLIKDFGCFQDRKRYYNERDEPLSAHIAHVEGEKWRLIRSKLSPTFTSLRMKQMFPLIVDIAEHLVKVLDPLVGDGNVVEIKDLLGRFTVDIIGSVIYGIECNSLENPRVEFRAKAEKAVSNPRHKEYVRLFMEAYPNLARKLRLKLLPDDVSSFFMKVTQDTIAYREKTHVRRRDFMDLLIQLKNFGTLEGHDGEIGKLTPNEIAAQAFAFYNAGIETSASTIGFALYALCMHPDLQEKTRKDILDTIAKYDGKFTYEAVAEMKYLHQVIDETLRMYSPAPGLLRMCTKDYKVAGTNFTIEKGTEVIVPVYGIHYDPEFYPNPGVFDPDNFLPEAVAKRPTCTYMGFGEGPRGCIGTRLGKHMTYTGMVYLLKNYRFTPSPKTPKTLQFTADVHNMRSSSDFFFHMEKL